MQSAKRLSFLVALFPPLLIAVVERWQIDLGNLMPLFLTFLFFWGGAYNFVILAGRGTGEPIKLREGSEGEGGAEIGPTASGMFMMGFGLIWLFASL